MRNMREGAGGAGIPDRGAKDRQEGAEGEPEQALDNLESIIVRYETKGNMHSLGSVPHRGHVFSDSRHRTIKDRRGIAAVLTAAHTR